jgi:hypothetical protein
VPFVQGRLRKEPLSVAIHTQCAHCEEVIHFDVDDRCVISSLVAGSDPRLFIPLVNFARLADPSIIDVF